MSATRAAEVTVTIVCPSWCEETAQHHADELWAAGGNCLHVLSRAVHDTTGHQEALKAPRMGRPVAVMLSTEQAPDGAETASPVVIIDGRELTLQQAEDLAAALSGLAAAYRTGAATYGPGMVNA